MSAITDNEPHIPGLRYIREAIEKQRSYLTAYEQPSESVTFEILRAVDDLYFRELILPWSPLSKGEHLYRRISSWGINHALRRALPRKIEDVPFGLFPSTAINRAKVDDFLFDCAALELAERYEGLLREGIFVGKVRPYPRREPQEMEAILELHAVHESYSDEEIGVAGLRWASKLSRAKDRPLERSLERRHRKISKKMEHCVHLVDGWRMVYAPTEDILEYFYEWGRLYLRRIFSQDLIGQDDVIGGRPFSHYTEVLTLLSTQAQMHLAFAAMSLRSHSDVHIRNIMTSYCQYDNIIMNIARSLGADISEIGNILSSLILSAENLDAHTLGGEPVWAPMVQASMGTILFPAYGMDINPFLFLLTDLRTRYEKDWFRVANNRERRWGDEIRLLFNGHRWQTSERNLRLREEGRDLTDIDFAVIDRKTNQLAIMQLKWQQPVGTSNRARRSAGKNLIDESTRWIEAVCGWLDRYGSSELARRLGFEAPAAPQVHLFIIGRYHSYFTGYDVRDSRAVWSDWAHFRRLRLEGQRRSIAQLQQMLQEAIKKSRAQKKGESMLVPVGNIAIVLNPTETPDDMVLPPLIP